MEQFQKVWHSEQITVHSTYHKNSGMPWLLGIKLEYIQKHTPEDNGNVESFHNSIKTDYIWPDEFRDFHDASIAIGKAFSDYYECMPHSSIDYLSPREFGRKFLDDPAFRERFEKKEVEVTLED